MPVINAVRQKWPLAAPVPHTPSPKKPASSPPKLRRKPAKKTAVPHEPQRQHREPTAFEMAMEEAAFQLNLEAELMALAMDDSVCPEQDQACCRCFCSKCSTADTH